ncbi:MAG: hypothetical protein AAF193_09635, partial [Bacteroidota bacterium]
QDAIHIANSSISSNGTMQLVGESNGNESDGINLVQGSVSSYQNMTIAGTANQNGMGINIQGAAVDVEIGQLSLVGQGGVSGGENKGVNIDDFGYVKTGSGNLNVDGYSPSTESTGNFGVVLKNGKILCDGSGSIEIKGEGTSGSNTDMRVLTGENEVGGPNCSGDITFMLNRVNWGDQLSVQSTGELFLVTRSEGISIGLGDAASGSCHYNDQEISGIVDQFAGVNIGNQQTGFVEIDDVHFSCPIKVVAESLAVSELNAGEGEEDINIELSNGGWIQELGSNSSFDLKAQDSEITGVLNPNDQGIGTFKVDGDLFLESGTQVMVDLLIQENGVNGVLNDKVTLIGESPVFEINSADLVLRPEGVEFAAIGDVFVLVEIENSGASAGIFNGLPEGSVLFLGNFDAELSYFGGDGNDITLTVISESFDTHVEL